MIGAQKNKSARMILVPHRVPGAVPVAVGSPHPEAVKQCLVVQLCERMQDLKQKLRKIGLLGYVQSLISSEWREDRIDQRLA